MAGITSGIYDVLGVVVVFMIFIATVGLIADDVWVAKGSGNASNSNLTSGQGSLLDISVLMYVILGVAIVLGGLNVIMKGRR